MKKQEYIDLGLSSGLSLSQIESVLMRVLQISKEELFKQIDISSRYIYEVQKIFFDLKNGASEEYILETANFYSREFYVDERVLIPRNDTEVLVREYRAGSSWSCKEKYRTVHSMKNTASAIRSHVSNFSWQQPEREESVYYGESPVYQKWG